MTTTQKKTQQEKRIPTLRINRKKCNNNNNTYITLKDIQRKEEDAKVCNSNNDDDIKYCYAHMPPKAFVSTQDGKVTAKELLKAHGEQKRTTFAEYKNGHMCIVFVWVRIGIFANI